MNWFYFMHPCVLFIMTPLLLLCLESTIVVTSLGNPLATVAAEGGGGGGGGRDVKRVTNTCFDKERQALLDIKAYVQNPYGQLSTWGSEDDDCCKWGGVTCNNQTSHVTKLQLSSCFIGGEISPSLINLMYLNHLDLSFNEINGTIPSFIGSMNQLTHLDLAYNSFNGIIPKSIGSLTQLRYLYLSFKSLHGTIPQEFGNLTNLRTLSLLNKERCCTGENLYWLSTLSHLEELVINGISLAKANHWVDVILTLRNLSYLSLSNCDLSEVMYPHSSFVNSSSSSIGFLDLSFNNLNSSMYRWLFPLTSNRLSSLMLSNNMLDTIPKYLGNLCSLTSLYLSSNSAMVEFPNFLHNLIGCTSVALQSLEARYSQFTGSLSNEIQIFSSLQTLILSHNHLNGTVSEKVWELPNLQTLDFSSNSLGGFISENIGKSKISYIDLSNNLLEVIPLKAHISNSSYVEYLDLSGCKLGTLFPKWIRRHKKLTRLSIASAKISDTIPVEFWNLWPSQLRHLNLSFNNISGEIPDLSSNFDISSVIDLSSNNFHGPIPNVPSTLDWLNLSKNKFHGGLSFLCLVDGLTFLDLSHNSLTGQLPDCLWHFKELQALNLGHNNLVGRLPASIGSLVQLQVLHLYSNNFSGELPLALKNCTELKFLNLGANKFYGNIPVWIGENLTRLYGLSLRSNNFFGTIPLQLCYLRNLQILDLSINNLNGTIPSCVDNLNAMVEGSFLPGHNTHSFGTDNKGAVGGSPRTYVDNAIIEWQGNEQEFTKNLRLLTSIDLSSNNLTGKIPNELADLHKLLALNLSKNALLGEIPRRIGEMKELLTLDLSRNNFSGGIPSTMSQMTSLNYLDISYNDLSGRIPSSTQLQSFEPSRYTGNVGLCGPPLTKNCSGDAVPLVEEGTDELERWFYIGGSIGFAIGFWIACGALLVNRRGRHAFFPFVDFWKDWVYVKVMVFFRKLQRVQHA